MRQSFPVDRMIAFINGRFVPEEQATVSVLDRGFLYGDGLFETTCFVHGHPFRWERHLERLQRGADYLRIVIPHSLEKLNALSFELIRRNELSHGALRLTLSRGVGRRGYSVRDCGSPTLALTLHPSTPPNPLHPLRWRLATSTVRVATGDPLAVHKTCNKLSQIIARTQAEAADADEAMILNTDNEIAEAATSNIFWLRDGVIHTPPLENGVLAGVTRELVQELAPALGFVVEETHAKLDALSTADAVFLSVSTLGIIEVIALDRTRVRQTPCAGDLHAAYWKAVETECRPVTPKGNERT